MIVDFTKFEQLTLGELRRIATEVGIQFSGGNENITEKQDFLLALDEADPKELEQSYVRIIAERGKGYKE